MNAGDPWPKSKQGNVWEITLDIIGVPKLRYNNKISLNIRMLDANLENFQNKYFFTRSLLDTSVCDIFIERVFIYLLKEFLYIY